MSPSIAVSFKGPLRVGVALGCVSGMSLCDLAVKARLLPKGCPVVRGTYDLLTETKN